LSISAEFGLSGGDLQRSLNQLVGFLVRATLSLQHAKQMQHVELGWLGAYHALTEPLGIGSIARLMCRECLLQHS
jgi:hypothetical protein